MIYRADFVELAEAEAIVREREAITDPARCPVRQAVREGRIKVFTRGALIGGDRDDLADMLARGAFLPGLTVATEDIDRLWPERAPTGAAGSPTRLFSACSGSPPAAWKRCPDESLMAWSATERVRDEAARRLSLRGERVTQGALYETISQMAAEEGTQLEPSSVKKAAQRSRQRKRGTKGD